MNISGVLVHAKPGTADAVRRSLDATPGVEVHTVTPDSRLVVTVEDEDDRMVADRVLELHRIDGVLSAAMVYQHSEDCSPEDWEETNS
jgi:nitrate reductase NapD